MGEGKRGQRKEKGVRKGKKGSGKKSCHSSGPSVERAGLRFRAFGSVVQKNKGWEFERDGFLI